MCLHFLTPVGDWCESHLADFDSMSLADVQERTSTICEAVADTYKFVTMQHLTRKPGRRDKNVAKLQRSLPPPDSAAYPAALAQLSGALQERLTKSRDRQTKQLHASLVSNRGFKRSIEPVGCGGSVACARS